MRFIYFAFLCSLLVGFSACEKSTASNCPADCVNNTLQHVQRVLLIGVDGCRPDALQKANTPNMDKLRTDGRYSWSVDRGNHYTNSGAGWSTMFTGVWHNKHGVTDNTFQGQNYGQYPHFFCRVKENNTCFKTASIVKYGQLNDHIAKPCNTDILLDYVEPRKVREATLNHLRSCDLDVVFVHLDEVDHAGHANGFHPDVPEYISAIESTDALIGEFVNAVYERESNNNEDWLIIVSSDHGGKIDGTHDNHDNDTEVTRVFSIFRTKNTANKGEMPYNPALVDIVPTIFDHLSIPVDTSWNLDGVKVDL